MGFWNGAKAEIKADEEAKSIPASYRIVEHLIYGIYIERGKYEDKDPGFSFGTVYEWHYVDYYGRLCTFKELKIYDSLEEARIRLSETKNFTNIVMIKYHPA